MTDIHNNPNLNEDVPGCVDNYFRFTINCWRIGYGWMDLILTLSITATTILTGLSTAYDDDPVTRSKFGNMAIVMGSASTLIQALKTHATKAIIERKSDLKEIITEYK